MIDLDALESLAKAAKPGDPTFKAGNIVLCRPDWMLELIAELRAAREVREQIRCFPLPKTSTFALRELCEAIRRYDAVTKEAQ